MAYVKPNNLVRGKVIRALRDRDLSPGLSTIKLNPGYFESFTEDGSVVGRDAVIEDDRAPRTMKVLLPDSSRYGELAYSSPSTAQAARYAKTAAREAARSPPVDLNMAMELAAAHQRIDHLIGEFAAMRANVKALTAAVEALQKPAPAPAAKAFPARALGATHQSVGLITRLNDGS